MKSMSSAHQKPTHAHTDRVDCVSTRRCLVLQRILLQLVESPAARRRAWLSRQGASMVFAVVVLLYYWCTGQATNFGTAALVRRLGPNPA